MTRSASGACRSVRYGSRPPRPPSAKATKKPDSADRVRAPYTTRYDPVRLRRLQELSVWLAPSTTPFSESDEEAGLHGPCQSAIHSAQGASGGECVGLSDSGVDLLRDVRGISANSWQHR
jgi:hypothetical protein